MSNARKSQGGWCDIKKLPRGPNGRACCRQCGSEVPKGRRSFCSKECVETWRVKTDPQFVRMKVFERDKGICAKCGHDCFEGKFNFHGSARRRRARGSGDLWQADHIIPVVEGGGECDLSNLRTLCTACHREETAALRRRMTERRKTEFQGGDIFQDLEDDQTLVCPSGIGMCE